jgi:hypothetical protein
MRFVRRCLKPVLGLGVDMLNRLIFCVVTLGLFESFASAQSVSKADFRRDVQPLLTEKCVGCHGPSSQMNGLS